MNPHYHSELSKYVRIPMRGIITYFLVKSVTMKFRSFGNNRYVCDVCNILQVDKDDLHLIIAYNYCIEQWLIKSGKQVTCCVM